jgi:thioredoxin-dependent peroxiredoxin
MPVTLEAGDRAPSFTMRDQDGVERRLENYRGQIAVLYFYPKDETAGCTTQACSLRDYWAEMQAEGATVLGVSTDDADSHRKFREHYELPFTLLVDEDARVSTVYGTWGEKVLYGRKSIGMTRATFIIGPDGTLLRVWKRVTAADHGATILNALQGLASRAR